MKTCPRDSVLLASNDVIGYRYFSCSRCSGYWIPGAALRHALSARGISELRGLSPSGPGDIGCPDCRHVCNQVQVDSCTLDACPQCHGVWLDGGEVARVVRLFPEGSALVDADQTGRAPASSTLLDSVDIVEALVEIISAALD